MWERGDRWPWQETEEIKIPIHPLWIWRRTENERDVQKEKLKRIITQGIFFPLLLLLFTSLFWLLHYTVWFMSWIFILKSQKTGEWWIHFKFCLDLNFPWSLKWEEPFNFFSFLSLSLHFYFIQLKNNN